MTDELETLSLHDIARSQLDAEAEQINRGLHGLDFDDDAVTMFVNVAKRQAQRARPRSA
jgi:hypothetical protein